MTEEKQAVISRDSVKIHVLAPDNLIYDYEIKKSVPLRTILNAYCVDHDLTAARLKFVFQGQEINAADNCFTLELQDGDIIEVYQHMLGGQKKLFY